MNLFIFLLIPLAAALLVLVAGRIKYLKEVIFVSALSANAVLALLNIYNVSSVSLPNMGFNLQLALTAYDFNNFILIIMAGLCLLLGIYTVKFVFDHSQSYLFYFYFLLTLMLAQGVVLSNNLIYLLIFWEAMLLPIYGFIRISEGSSGAVAQKAFIIIGVSELLMMFGVGLTVYLAQTAIISSIALTMAPLSAVAFVLLMLGAIAKSGAMPFHSWIPDAATAAPLPFMALMPGAMEKLVGIYFLYRICLEMFKLTAGSSLCYLLMIIGAITILLAVGMALIQKNFKRLLAYHAISQVGYMVLGIGTGIPIGIVGGLFHMLNNALYKSCLFLTGGMVEKQTGTTDLEKISGLGRVMPFTFAAFFIAALSISGVPPFNGFFSKEMVYEAALEQHWLFYAAALLGSFLTAASFLKLGAAAFLGEKKVEAKEASAFMYLPALIIAVVCVLLGLFSGSAIALFSRLTVPAHFEFNVILTLATIAILCLALLNHYYGVKKTGKALSAVDHIHYFPLLYPIYTIQEKGWLDPYNWLVKSIDILSIFGYGIDRLINAIEMLVAQTTLGLSQVFRKMHSGNYSVYLVWALSFCVIFIWYMIR